MTPYLFYYLIRQQMALFISEALLAGIFLGALAEEVGQVPTLVCLGWGVSWDMGLSVTVSGEPQVGHPVGRGPHAQPLASLLPSSPPWPLIHGSPIKWGQ